MRTLAAAILVFLFALSAVPESDVVVERVFSLDATFQTDAFPGKGVFVKTEAPVWFVAERTLEKQSLSVSARDVTTRSLRSSSINGTSDHVGTGTQAFLCVYRL